tara:strand:+ start:545 stop:682 length:138 start_codon:yes stop_codon:yes gene_type:complete
MTELELEQEENEGIEKLESLFVFSSIDRVVEGTISNKKEAMRSAE